MINIELNNGTTIPALGFGVFKVADGKECVNAVKEALKVGYRHIDTAAIYRNEKSVGHAIKESGIPREEIYLTTKLWNDVQRGGVAEEALNKSLEDLQVDYIDLYLVHWPVPGKYAETWLAMEKLLAGGKVKTIGVSNFHEHHLDDVKKIWSVVPAVNQIELHPELSQKPLIQRCKEDGITVQSWSPLGAAKNDLLVNPVIRAIGEKYNKTNAQIILRWNIEQGIVTLPKSVTPSRIKENFEIFDFALTLEEMEQINGLNKDLRVGADPDNFNF